MRTTKNPIKSVRDKIRNATQMKGMKGSGCSCGKKGCGCKKMSGLFGKKAY